MFHAAGLIKSSILSPSVSISAWLLMMA